MLQPLTVSFQRRSHIAIHPQTIPVRACITSCLICYPAFMRAWVIWLGVSFAAVCALQTISLVIFNVPEGALCSETVVTQPEYLSKTVIIAVSRLLHACDVYIYMYVCKMCRQVVEYYWQEVCGLQIATSLGCALAVSLLVLFIQHKRNTRHQLQPQVVDAIQTKDHLALGSLVFTVAPSPVGMYTCISLHACICDSAWQLQTVILQQAFIVMSIPAYTSHREKLHEIPWQSGKNICDR